MDAGSAQLIAESDEAGSVVAMVVAEDDSGMPRRSMPSSRLLITIVWGRPPVSKDAATVGFCKRREAPLSNTPAVGEHSRQNSDLQRFHASCRLGGEWQSLCTDE